MPEWFSGDLDLDGVRIHYSWTDSDKRPLVLSHGATDGGLCWTRQPLTTMICFRVWIGSVRSDWAAITASIGL